MLKEDVISFIVYILMIAIAAIVGFGVITPAFKQVTNINGMNTSLFLFIALVISIIVEIIMFEVAHMVGAKIGGYEVLSVNILGFCFYKAYSEEKKKYVVKFKFKNFDGLTGETICTPKKEKANPTSFVLSPLILFLVEVVIFVFLWVFIPTTIKGNKFVEPLAYLDYFQMVLITIGGMLFIYNYFPAKLDCTTDGYRLVLLNKKINVEAYNVLLTIQGDELLGKQVESYPTFKEITDFTASVNLQSVRNFIRTGKYEEALPLLEEIITTKAKVSFNTIVIAKMYKLEIYLLTKPVEEGKALYDGYDDKDRFYLKSEFTMQTIRTGVLYYGLIEKSQSECENQIHHVKKALAKEIEQNKKNEEVMLKNRVAFLNEHSEDVKVTY